MTAGRPKRPSARAELLHFLGEVEVVFGLWAVVLSVAAAGVVGWESMVHYVNGTVNYTEPLFVVVIMAIASTRPVVGFAESALRRLATSAAIRLRPGGSSFSPWTGARLLHHRTRGHDHLRAPARAAVLRSAADGRP